MSAPEGAAGPASRPAARVWTVLDLLRWTTDHFAQRGIETARLDAECLLAHALGVARLRLYLDFEKPVLEAERRAFRELVRRRAGERVPVSQLVGSREFWSLPLRVDARVLTPRPETETLVTAALDLGPGPGVPARVLEVGTGSGAVALALASERPRWVIEATDSAEEALKIAQENAETLGMAERIAFHVGDLTRPIAGRRFALLVSNPPYVAESERPGLPPELAHEPERALFGGPDGLDVLRRLVAEAPAVLSPGGIVALEHGAEQGEVVARLLRDAGFAEVGTRRDLAGHPRVTHARWPDAAGGGC